MKIRDREKQMENREIPLHLAVKSFSSVKMDSEKMNLAILSVVITQTNIKQTTHIKVMHLRITVAALDLLSHIGK